MPVPQPARGRRASPIQSAAAADALQKLRLSQRAQGDYGPFGVWKLSRVGECCSTNNIGMRALVKLVTSWVKVPPVELAGSRSKRGIRDEAVKPNHQRDMVWNCRVATKVNLI